MCWLFSGPLSLFILHSIRHKRLECLQYHEYQQRLNLHLRGVAKIFLRGGGTHFNNKGQLKSQLKAIKKNAIEKINVNTYEVFWARDLFRMTVDKGEVRINNHAYKSKATQMRRGLCDISYTALY